MPRQRSARRRMRLRRWLRVTGRPCVGCALGTFASLLLVTSSTKAQEQPSPIRNTYGEVGTLDMPSGHMAPDGQLAFTVGVIGGQQRYSLSFQALPWLATSFRYTYRGGIGPNADYHRNFAATVRLAQEGAYTPDISIGIRNLIGTGRGDSEFLAASKHIGSLDLTAGLGWGELADSGTLPNPFGYIFSSFKTRTLPSTPTGGTVNFGTWFHGPRTGVFGGAVWRTPINGLSLLAEYSSDRYTGYIYPGAIKVRTSVNVGLSYQLGALSLSGGWFYGTTYGFTISLSGDPTASTSAVKIGPQVPAAVVRSDKQQQSALTQMLDTNSHVAVTKAGGAWVHLPTQTEKTKQDLMQAFLSESHGVRDAEVQGTMLVLNAQSLGNSLAQCQRYAQIAFASKTKLSSIAMSDLESPDGTVTFCPVATRASYVEGDAQSAPSLLSTPESTPDQEKLERTLRVGFKAQSLTLDALSLGKSELWIYYENTHYLNESEAAGRVARLLMAAAPPSIEMFHLIAVQNGRPMQEIRIARSALERVTQTHGVASELGDAVLLRAAPLDNPALELAGADLYPRFRWSIQPALRESFFDPNRPLQFQFLAVADAEVEIARGWSLETELSGNIFNNYNFGLPAASQLPHVRSDVMQYLKQGAYGISNLDGVYRTRLTRDVFAEVKAGYLEDMYAGAGAQILWRPDNSRFTIGADLYEVWKRDFNRLFGIQGYHVLTGHVSVYYQLPWYGLNMNVHVGRYLARDYGATLEFTRRFSTGVEIGAFATFTNVPFSTFGEGSFDKGIIIHIPFEWALPFYSQSSYDLYLHSLTRDGGQRLQGDDSLYDETRGTSYGEIAQHLDDIVEP